MKLVRGQKGVGVEYLVAPDGSVKPEDIRTSGTQLPRYPGWRLVLRLTVGQASKLLGLGSELGDLTWEGSVLENKHYLLLVPFPYFEGRKERADDVELGTLALYQSNTHILLFQKVR